MRGKFILCFIILVLVVGVIFWVWNKWTGKYYIGADAIIGCQNPNMISNFFGQPGRNLIDYDLFGHRVKINERIKHFLDSAQKEISKANTGYNFENVTTFNIRPKIWGGGKSLHSWAIAIDINPSRNLYQPGNYGPPRTDLPDQIVNAFKKYGFAWGGDWPGERDPMHFEWYGGELLGSILDAQSGQKILDAAAFVNGAGAHLTNGDFSWVLEAGKHKITIKANGYEETNFDVDIMCFRSQKIDIALKPLPDNTPGRISGQVSLMGNKNLLLPATIILDDKIVGASNIKGDFLITNVRKGKHIVEAKILFYPSAKITTPEMKPGDDLENVNIIIGR